MTPQSKIELFRQIDEIRRKLPKGDLLYTAGRVAEVHFHHFDSQKLGAVLIGGRVIVVNASRPESAQRFSLAHELVHYYLHWGKVDLQHRTPEIERQANEGAAELLLPRKEVAALAAAHRHGSEEQLVRLLASRYGVSPSVARYKLNSMGVRVLSPPDINA